MTVTFCTVPRAHHTQHGHPLIQGLGQHMLGNIHLGAGIPVSVRHLLIIRILLRLIGLEDLLRPQVNTIHLQDLIMMPDVEQGRMKSFACRQTKYRIHRAL